MVEKRKLKRFNQIKNILEKKIDSIVTSNLALFIFEDSLVSVLSNFIEDISGFSHYI
jgi:hypothetical protein